MAKTKQIGVRFDEELWEKFDKMGITTAQKKLNFLESWYLNNLEKVIAFNNLPQNKSAIEEIRNGEIKSKVSKIIDATKEQRVKQLEHEINNPPSKFSSALAMKVYFHDRKKELNEINKQLNNIN